MSPKSQSERIRAKLRNLGPEAVRRMVAVNDANAASVAALARTLVSVGQTGRARAAIKSYSQGEEGAIIDFGPLSRILEGGTEPRVTKAGASRGIGPKRPFVNPAMKATARKRGDAMRRVIRDIVKNG